MCRRFVWLYKYCHEQFVFERPLVFCRIRKKWKRKMEVKWLQWDSNPQPLSSQTDTQAFINLTIKHTVRKMKHLSAIGEWQKKNFEHLHSEILLGYTSCCKACVIYVKSRFHSLQNCKTMTLKLKDVLAEHMVRMFIWEKVSTCLFQWQ